MPRTGLTREQIIERAARLANERGLSALTVTTLAEALGIRKPSLYNHMRSIDDVIRGIMILGWSTVSRELVAAIVPQGPEENLKACARAFYRFALDQPGVFEAMLWYNRYAGEDLLQATEGLYQFFFRQTDAMGLDRETANHLLRTYRAFLEGFLLLQVHHAFGNPISVPESFEISLDVLVHGMKVCRNADGRKKADDRSNQ